MIRSPVLANDDLSALFRVGAIGGLPDAELLARFASGRGGAAAEAAFRILVDRHGPMVLGVCRRVLGDSHSAADAFQATFLILARKAGSVRVEGSLGRWLHGVSRRVAKRAKAGILANRAFLNEFRPTEPTPAPSSCDELRAIIDEEIGHLPSRYRSAVILCYLEGLTQEQAASRLLCPVGTIQSRLHQARERLRTGLTRRGLAPGVLFASTLTTATAKADVAAQLALATVPLGSGVGLAGAVPAAVAVLVRHELWGPLVTKLILGSVATIAALGALAIGRQVPAVRGDGPAPAAKTGAAAPKAQAKPAPAKSRILAGVVLDPLGMPVDGATVVVGLAQTGKRNHRVLTTDAEGRFAWMIPDGDTTIYVAAHQGDLAPATWENWYPADKRPEPIKLTLKVAQPASGILVDAAGRPVAGAKVRVEMCAFKSESPRTDGGQGMTTTVRFGGSCLDVIAGSPLHQVLGATTDRDGAFTLPAAPGPYLKLRITTADGSEVRASAEAKGGGKAPALVGLEAFVLAWTAEPQRLIVSPTARIAGRVTTAMPRVKLAGLKVFIQASEAGGAIGRHGNINVPPVAVGEDGRFAIDNLDEGAVNVYGDGESERWTYRAGKDVPLIPGETATLAIELIPGVIAEGMVVDQDGKPIKGAMIGAYGPNHPRSGAATRSEMTDDRGRFRHRVPSGENFFYVMNTGDTFRALPGQGSSRTVTIPDGDATFAVTPILVEAAVVLHGKVVDAKGKLLAGVAIIGVGRPAQYAMDPGVTLNPAGVTDAKGEFRLKGQNHSAPQGKPATLRVRRKDGKEVEVEVTPAADGAVRVELPDEN